MRIYRETEFKVISMVWVNISVEEWGAKTPLYFWFWCNNRSLALQFIMIIKVPFTRH